MKVLIVEDDQNKIKVLSHFLSDSFDEVEIVNKRSYQSGLKQIISNTFDFILLDMSMPTFDISPHEIGGSPMPFAGKEILIQMHKRKIKTPVIVVTQFERFGDGSNEIQIEELKNDLGKFNNYIATVYYNAALNNWRDDLITLIDNLGYRSIMPL